MCSRNDGLGYRRRHVWALGPSRAVLRFCLGMALGGAGIGRTPNQ